MVLIVQPHSSIVMIFNATYDILIIANRIIIIKAHKPITKPDRGVYPHTKAGDMKSLIGNDTCPL